MDAIGRDEITGRSLFVLEAAEPSDIPASVSFPSAYFVCLLAWDARQASDSDIRTVADRLIRAGCVYVCCWGPDCERVHDLFDSAELELRPDGPWSMSTCHGREPLSDAMWFAIFTAWPDAAFVDECRSVVGIAIGSPAWAAEMRAAFTDPGNFSARVLGPDDEEDNGG